MDWAGSSSQYAAGKYKLNDVDIVSVSYVVSVLKIQMQAFLENANFFYKKCIYKTAGIKFPHQEFYFLYHWRYRSP